MREERAESGGAGERQLDPLLLAVLAEGPAHGFSVVEKLRQKSELSCPEGAVYPALHRLEESRLLVSRWQKIDGRSWRVYSLSDRGLKLLGEGSKARRRLSRRFAALGGTA